MHMYNPEVVEKAREVGEFYLQKNNGDREKAEEEILRCEFLNMELIRGELYLYTSRPGVVIGKRGQNIDDLASFIGMPIKIIEENNINHFIIPPEDDGWDLEAEQAAYDAMAKAIHEEYEYERKN